MKRTALSLGLVAAALLPGCTVGPDFKRPEPPAAGGYTPTPLAATVGTPGVAGGGAQCFAEGMDIPAEWWTLFQSKPLSDLIERALVANPDLRAAQAALSVARENVLAQKGGSYPSVSGAFSAGRHKTSEDISPTPNSGELYYSVYTPQVSVSYLPDVFGLNRRTIESLEAQARQARFALAATRITLSANVVVAAVQEASLRTQIEATREVISVNAAMVEILRKQYMKGYVSRLDLAAQESQLAQVTVTLPPLFKQLAVQRDLLAALAGAFPGDGLVETFELSGLRLPEELPVSVPSRLVEQRPDVRQAEENLHAASAQIGIAVANRLPSFPLSADLGSMALAAGRIFAAGTGFWDLAGSITQPIFQGGTLLHRERAARAAYLQAAEQYRSAVLAAFQNVADTLQALDQDAAALEAAAAARSAASVTLELARKQWQTATRTPSPCSTPSRPTSRP
jgi:NodT family efflux transporter outer membrane factor (OMF) lipoprotein